MADLRLLVQPRRLALFSTATGPVMFLTVSSLPLPPVRFAFPGKENLKGALSLTGTMYEYVCCAREGSQGCVVGGHNSLS